MANRWETMETVTDFFFCDSKITADGDCSHEIKRHLLLGRKTMTNLEMSEDRAGGEIDGETLETVTEFVSWGLKSLQMLTAVMKLKDACSLEEKL